MDFDTILNQIVQEAVVPLIIILVGSVSAYLASLANKSFAETQAWIRAQKYGPEVLALFDIAVSASEQLGLSAKIRGEIIDKKNAAIDAVVPLLHGAGIRFSDQQIDALIEEAVWRNFNFSLTPEEVEAKVKAANSAEYATR